MIYRREFLQQSTTAALAASASAAQAAGGVVKPEVIPICDTHQHLWDLTKFKLPWTADVPALNRSFVTRDYLEATNGLNVTKSVYMEVDVEAPQQLKEVEHVTGLCKKKDDPMRAAVVSGRPSSPEFRAYLDKLKGNAYVKGVRQVIHVPSTPKGFCLSNEFIAGVRLLAERGLSFDICIRQGELLDAARLVDACPDTRFILDHCGNAMVKLHERGKSAEHKQWKADLSAVAQRKHVWCKVSGLIDKAHPGWTADDLAPIVKHVVSEFGWNRVMFGGDWPVCTLGGTYKQWVEALRQIVRDARPEDQRKLFHDNAVKFYELKDMK